VTVNRALIRTVIDHQSDPDAIIKLAL